MCAQYKVKSRVKDLEIYLDILDGENSPWRRTQDADIPEEFDTRIVPYTAAPVIKDDGVRIMRFSLLPAWSSEPKVKFATHNARIETVAEKATWKKPFLRHHCIVPMNTFIEPIYTGQLAGNMVGFTSDHILCAAGIHDSWVNKKTGEIIESFAIITDEPSDFVRHTGHDRQPVFLNKAAAKEWLKLEGEPKRLLDFLKDNSEVPKFETSIDRPMRPGWEKRAP